ncbi:long-chain-fatty-acid--CoA ligase [Echinococcus multilocularis]|uniref:Long-chain-fatty-acid--CoA ligase n=1 Tax=Echinococcus multilocularis TaxID=6211 RepID=A0A068XZF8_ECHMU|nr:long-chain-fatty-acid--CoA ligase [Echinococcus multilocularis]
MSESNGRSSPRLQIKVSRRLDGSRKQTPEKRRFDEDMSPVSPRESPTPSSSERSPSARHSRHRHSHHLSHKYVRRRDREMASYGRSGRVREEKHHSERKRRRPACEVVVAEGVAVDSVDTDEAGEYSLRRGSDYKPEGRVKNEIVAAEEEEGERQQRERYRRDHRRRSLEREEEEVMVAERRSFNRKYVDERGSRRRSNRSQEKRSKRARRRSESRHSQSLVTLSYGENRSSSSVKQHLNPFVSTLLEPLLKEATSDTDLEEVLPVSILSGEMAKRSMLLPADQTNKLTTSQLQQSQNQVQKSQEQQLKLQRSPDHAKTTTATLQTAGSNKIQKSVEEGDSRFDRFLSNLSERLQEREQELETWGEREIDFSDILTEDSGALHLAVSSAALKPKQLLESSLSTQWQRITENSPDEVETIKIETEITEDKEDPLNLATLLSSSVSRRFLGDHLVRELEERGVSLPPIPMSDVLAGSKESRLGMVPTIFEEVSWRQRLLGVICT